MDHVGLRRGAASWGALSTHGATRGVLMTTSTFTEEARRTAAGARTAHIALAYGLSP